MTLKRNPFGALAATASAPATAAKGWAREGVTKPVTPAPAAAGGPRRPNGAKERQARAISALGQFNAKRALAGLAGALVGGAARIVVPFPPAGLNPNARHAHPAKKAPLARAYRETCWALTLEALGTRYGQYLPDGPVRVHLDFFPPTGAKRDDDNLEAAFKAGRDGISEALGIDDARWQTSKRLRAEVRGCVVVTLIPVGDVFE